MKEKIIVMYGCYRKFFAVLNFANFLNAEKSDREMVN